ncbi:hypothetical protein FRC17_006727, partial [Serendipita sp. 399]
MSFPNSQGSLVLLGGVATAAVAFISWAYATYQRDLRAVGGIPGPTSIVNVNRHIMNILPAGKLPLTNLYFNFGGNFWLNSRYKVFNEIGSDIISILSLDFAGPTLGVADAEAIQVPSAQEIMRNPARFVKPTEIYATLNIYGRNVVTINGEEYRIHKKITSPSFSESNNRLVFRETQAIVDALFETWEGKDRIDYDNALPLTVALTLMVISSAGFGVRIPWGEEECPPGHQLSFKTAIEGVSAGLLLKVAVPPFAMAWTKHTTHIENCFKELGRYMHRFIQERSGNHDYEDLLSNLISANENDGEGLKLTEDEVVGNIFIFLIAGHETTAHTLAFCLGFLALYPDIQQKLYEHIRERVADPHGSLTYDELSNLPLVLAVFYETLRFFPAVQAIPRICISDTTLKSVKRNGDPISVPVPAGSVVNVATGAVHFNPRYWKDPEEFRPERFLGDWPKHAFVPFAAGARA